MAETKKEQVKGKVKKLLLGKKELLADEDDEQINEQAVDQTLLSAIAARPRGGLMSVNDQRRNALQLVFLVLLLEDTLPPVTYDGLIGEYAMSGRDQNATLAMANPAGGETESRHRTKVRRYIQDVQQIVGVTADGDLGHGTLAAIEDYVAKRLNGDGRFRNFNVGGNNRPMRSAEIVDAAIRAQGLDPSTIRITSAHSMSRMIEDNVNAALDVLAAQTSAPGKGGRMARGPRTNAVGAPAAPARQTQPDPRVDVDALKKQGDEIMGQLTWWNDFNNQLTLAASGAAGIGVALTGIKDGIGTALSTSSSFIQTAAKALNKYVPGFRKSGVDGGASASVIPLAVITALAIGGAFQIRKYLKNRKNIQLARKLAADRAFMAEIDRITGRYNVGSYANSRDTIDAIRELEMLEARNARYMRYM